MERRQIKIKYSDQNLRQNSRPVAITVICVVDFIGAVGASLLIFSNIAATVGRWYPPYLGFSCVVGLLCMIGLWIMKKWAVYVYTVFFVINQIVLLMTNRWNLLGFLLLIIIIGILWAYIRKMD